MLHRLACLFIHNSTYVLIILNEWQELIDVLMPIEQVVSLGNGVYETIRKRTVKLQGKRPIRGDVRMCSKKSLLRLMAVLQATPINFRYMYTLTYPKYYPKDGDIVKKDLNAILQKMRRDNAGQYLWFLEFQTRGAPHIHILIDRPTVTPRFMAEYGLYWTGRMCLSEWFIEQCPEEDYNKNVIRTAKFQTNANCWDRLVDPEGAKRYGMKYASKEKQKSVPRHYKNVGRFWGASKDVLPDKVTLDVAQDEFEEFLKKRGWDAEAWAYTPKYIWPTNSGQEVDKSKIYSVN